ncbi:PAN domain-containing protein [Mameliella sediminis]|uniref:PAN domain-containing protein n=1 Tax=Mameliella sediminis TaxID=2836866 RepID=UPI001C496707|nr:PAN domain-containing protein [Mameliella sediminis]MBV7396816.1 PAN domain-containing protein [Mameliella sediminis]MBY6116226.1 PAN domain-containing protein [Antarctobacter heliothermus]MBY6146191.1 PAN domain-containing protein [Mameliella alba]MCA0955376.1 PAN domain-containing protein [Mameliella alba]
MAGLFRIFLVATAAMVAMVGISRADEGCKIYPTGSVIEWHYDLIGAEACAASCVETEGCQAWSYAPHNFNPKSAPGECRLLPDSGTREEHARDFCGLRAE